MQAPNAATRPSHSQLVEQRWDGLEARVNSKLAQVVGFDRQRESQLLGHAAQARTAAQRVQWLRKGADALVEAIRPLAACRKGCSHCCHIAVVVSQAEAVVIAKETGHSLNSKAGRALGIGDASDADAARQELTDQYKGTPCVFLKEGACEIYEHRPLACRLLMNLDDDDLLCQLVEDGPAPRVPYLNTQAHDVRALMVLGNQQYADIREWFAA